MRQGFVGSAIDLKKALEASLASADLLDVAVAFIGKGWEDIIGTFTGFYPDRLLAV